MTSSGTYNYNISAAEAVLAALERCQIRAPSIRTEHMNTAKNEFNLLMAEWANKQVNLWKVELDTVALVQGTATYTLTPQTVMVLDAYVSLNYGTTSQSDTYITPMSRTQYASIGNKSTQGRPTSYWFDRTITPTLTMWPVPDASGPYQMSWYAAIQIQDVSLPSGTTLDLPYRWLDAAVAGLAYRMARVYAPQLVPMLKQDAMEAWQTAATQDVENANFSIAPSLSSFYRR